MIAYDYEPYDKLSVGTHGMYWLGLPCYPEPCCSVADCCSRHAHALARNAAAKEMSNSAELREIAEAKEAAEKRLVTTHENLYEIGDRFAVKGGGGYHYFTLVSFDKDNGVSVELNGYIYKARREIEMVGDECGFTGNLKIDLEEECVLAIPSYAVGIRG